jgi:hypothetical protein
MEYSTYGDSGLSDPNGRYINDIDFIQEELSRYRIRGLVYKQQGQIGREEKSGSLACKLRRKRNPWADSVVDERAQHFRSDMTKQVRKQNDARR